MSQNRAAMQIFLPIVEVSVNALKLIGLGTIVGLMSGLFGVGGGFLITPLLFLIGIRPAIAVATGANQVVASSFSGVLAHLRRKSVDIPMGLVQLVGGIAGSALGVLVFNLLQRLGRVDLVVQLCHVVLLGIIGLTMLRDSLAAMLGARRPVAVRRRLHQHSWVHRLPWNMKLRASGLYISVIPPLLVGVAVGVLAAIMGVGDGFIMVPAMIYRLGMPTMVEIGTSLFQLGARLRAEQLRVLLALLVRAVCGKPALDLVLPPADLFFIAPGKS